jgi:hypothetical protein
MNFAASTLRRFLRLEAGTATVEFVIAVPLVLSILFSSIDFGAVMLRQVFLDRAVDLAVREVRLGNIPSNGIDSLRSMICQRTVLISDCVANMTIELRPIDTDTWAGLDTPVQCINRSANIAPTLTFNPSAGNQDLMLVRVCASIDPFLSITGMVLGMGNETGGDLRLVSVSAFTNEPI